MNGQAYAFIILFILALVTYVARRSMLKEYRGYLGWFIDEIQQTISTTEAMQLEREKILKELKEALDTADLCK